MYPRYIGAIYLSADITDISFFGYIHAFFRCIHKFPILIYLFWRYPEKQYIHLRIYPCRYNSEISNPVISRKDIFASKKDISKKEYIHNSDISRNEYIHKWIYPLTDTSKKEYIGNGEYPTDVISV